MITEEYNNEYFRLYFNCVTNPEVVAEAQKKMYLTAFRRSIISMICRTDVSVPEVNKQVALAVTRAYLSKLITADESQSLLRYKRIAIELLRKGE